MKGTMEVIIKMGFLVLLMLVVIGVGLSMMRGKAEIPFEELWEKTPEEGVTTQPGIIPPTESFTTKMIWADRPLSAGDPTYDLSEIACQITQDIYNDFTPDGLMGSWSNCVEGMPTLEHKECFVKAKRFIYGTNAKDTDADETTLQNFDPNCYLCRTGGAGTGITDLDEVCLNLNFKNRTVVQPGDFCDGYWGVKVSQQFGNCDCGDERNGVAWNDNCDGYTCYSWPCCFNWCGYACAAPRTTCDCDHSDDFCNNEWNRLDWSAFNDNTGERWRVKEYCRPDQAERNSETLTNNRDYLYGVYWVDENKNYDVVFALIPDGDNYEAGNWDDIWETFTRDERNYRVNVLGNRYEEARVVANFTIDNAPDIPLKGVGSLTEKIHDEASVSPQVDYPEVICSHCSGSACYGYVSDANVNQYGGEYGDYWFLRQPITILTNATKSDGIDPIDGSCLASLTGGAGKRYRVIIKNWWGCYRERNFLNQWFNDFDYFQRTVTILQLWS